MEETIFKGKFLFRFIHLITILSTLFIFFIIVLCISPSFQLILIILLLGLLNFILIYTSLPRNILLNDNGIHIKKPLSSKEKYISWKNIQSVKEKTYYRRDKFLKILLYIIFYGFFFLLFKERYKCLFITDNLFNRYQIYEYSYKEYYKICNIINEKI